MKPILFIILFTISVSFSAFAQIDENQSNPFKAGRVNYFKHTIIFFNEYLDTENGSCNTTNVRKQILES